MWWWGTRLVGLVPCIPVPFVETFFLGVVAFLFASEVSDLARFS